MSSRFKAIVFDFDGLIVDTEVPEYEAWLGIFRSYGVDLPLSVWTPHIGGGHDGFDIYAHLAELTGMRVDRDELRDRSRSAFAGLFKHAVPLPGVEDYIATARERGMRIGIASSSTHPWVDPKLEQIGLSDAFDTVVCSEDVGRSKPNPASYLRALADLGVTSDETFALGGLPNRRSGSQECGPALRSRARRHDPRSLVRPRRYANRVACRRAA